MIQQTVRQQKNSKQNTKRRKESIRIQFEKNLKFNLNLERI